MNHILNKYCPRIDFDSYEDFYQNFQINVPEARQAMYNMKHEVANELGITLNNGYNGNLSSKDAGQIGGNMVKKMIEAQEKQMGGAQKY